MEQTKGKRVMVLSAGVGSGHNSAAKALEAAFRAAPGVGAVRMLDALELGSRVYKMLFSDTYFKMVEAAPWLVSLVYDANDAPFKDANLPNVWEQLNSSKLVSTIREYQPDIVVCTHFLPAKLISILLARQEIQTHLSVVTTDYDVQGLWLSSPFSHFFVAREETRAYMIDFGLPPDRVSTTGIPVNLEFNRPLDREAVLGRYELDGSRPIVLISAGAAGSKFTQQIVAQTLRMQNDFQTVVICGRNKKLKRAIEAQVAEKAGQYRVLGFTREMPDLMRMASVFIGKPGGLTSAECMAAGLPMALVKPIPGQEVRNSDFLMEEGAALRCNYDITIGYKIDQLLGDPQRLKQMAANACRVGRADAAQAVVQTVLADQAPPLVISRQAQNAILAAAEEGESARHAPGVQGLQTLVDAVSGRSVAVVTGEQIDQIGPHLPAGLPLEAGVPISDELMAVLEQSKLEADLLSILGRVRAVTEKISFAARSVISPDHGG